MIALDFVWATLAMAVPGAFLGWWCTGLACRYSDFLLDTLMAQPQAAEPLAGAVQVPATCGGSGIGWFKSDGVATVTRRESAPCLLIVCSGALLAGLAGVFYARHGVSLIFAAYIVAMPMLLALAIIDAKTSLLPDAVTLPLLWLGLGLAWVGGTVTLHASLAGAMAGYGFLFAMFWLFKIVRKKEGMGYGDFKLLAALGAWVGVSNLPYVLLLACLTGLLYAAWRQKNLALGAAYPFGPFLAASGAAVMAFAPEVHSYF